MKERPNVESAMAAPVLTLFPTASYHHFEQVPFGRKRIDLVCAHRSKPQTTTIELKIEDWQQALWQASLNCQVAHKSYIAIWECYVHRVEKQRDLLHSYGVGLIAVSPSSARIVLPSRDLVRRIPKTKKSDWYRHLLVQ